MANCIKLAKYLRNKQTHYEFEKVKKFLLNCCGLKFRQGRGSHTIFYPEWADPNDVRTQITIPLDHKNKRYVKKAYVANMWKDLFDMGIISEEDFE